MLILIFISIVIGLVVSGLSGFGILGIVAGIFFFVCGLPGAILGSFIHGEVSYAQDRADLRQFESDCAAREVAEEHEYLEENRTERLIDTVRRNPTKVYHDNRQVHFHGRE